MSTPKNKWLVGDKLAHYIHEHWGEGTIIEILPRKDFAGITRTHRYVVKFANRLQPALMRPSDMRRPK